MSHAAEHRLADPTEAYFLFHNHNRHFINNSHYYASKSNNEYTNLECSDEEEDSLVQTTFVGVLPQEQTSELVDRAKQTIAIRDRALRAALHACVHTYTHLNDGWDGYNAHSMSAAVISNATELINNLPFDVVDILDIDNIFPTPNGTITIEHEFDDGYIVIDIGQSKILYYCKYNGKLKGLNNPVPYTESIIKDICKLFRFCKQIKSENALAYA